MDEENRNIKSDTENVWGEPPTRTHYKDIILDKN
jgi:hypothetical protein